MWSRRPMKKRTLKVAAVAAGLAVVVYAVLLTWALLPRSWSGTAQRIEDVPVYGKALAGLEVEGPVRYHVEARSVRQSRSCVISGRSSAAAVRRWAAARGGARLDVEDSYAPRDLSALVRASANETRGFNVAFDDHLWVIGTDPHLAEPTGVSRHVELYVRLDDGRFLLVSW